MSDETPPTLDAGEIAIQTAALAQHLRRSGVQWMPKPQSEAVESLLERFVVPTIQSPTIESQVQPPTEASTLSTDGPTSAPISPTTPPQRAESVTSQSSLVSGNTGPYPENLLSAEARQPALQDIDTEVKSCQRCEILSKCRTNTVFGEGSPSPRFVFFGEGPGVDEDRSGRPFVGRAGQLLTKMIEACTLKREDVYILNSVKCRPPGNRNPEPGELQNCREFYRRQLDVLRPEYIICLGAISSQELLQNKLPVGQMRGSLHQYFESKVLVTYHPAYLLRTPAAKKAVWEDLQFLMRDAGIQLL